MNIENAMAEELSAQIINTTDAAVPTYNEMDANLTALRQDLNAVIGL